jgi:ABC-2 type transport system permease protein
MLGFPVETLVGLVGRHDAVLALGAQWGYVALFGLAALWVWRVGLRTFSAYGG